MDVFVYGTLTEPPRVSALLDSYAFVGAATLSGLRAVEGEYPTLAPPVSRGGGGGGGADGTSDDGERGADGGNGDDGEDGDSEAGDTRRGGDGAATPDAAVGGRLLRTDEVAALDRYEGVDDGLYVRVTVPLVGPDGEREGDAAVYVGDPRRLGAEADWPGGGSFPERVRRGVDELGVRVERRPEA